MHPHSSRSLENRLPLATPLTLSAYNVSASTSSVSRLQHSKPYRFPGGDYLISLKDLAQIAKEVIAKTISESSTGIDEEILSPAPRSSKSPSPLAAAQAIGRRFYNHLTDRPASEQRTSPRRCSPLDVPQRSNEPPPPVTRNQSALFRANIPLKRTNSATKLPTQ